MPSASRTRPPARRVRRLTTAVVVVTSLWAGVTAIGTGAVGATPGQAEEWSETEEQQFVALINDLRVSKGLGALTIDVELVTEARSWSRTMAARGSIFHSDDLSAGISANWQKLGENVGVGGSVTALFEAFVASPSHYDNLVDPSFTRVGIGVIRSGDRIFTAHRFMALMEPVEAVEPVDSPARLAAITAPTGGATSAATASGPAGADDRVDGEPPAAAARRTPTPADPEAVRADLRSLAELDAPHV